MPRLRSRAGNHLISHLALYALLCVGASVGAEHDAAEAARPSHHVEMGASSHVRDLKMELWLSNETRPVDPRTLIRDRPTVNDSGQAGATLPPRNPMRALNASELLIPPTHEYVAMCLVTIDAGEDVREWLLHYLRLGVGHIYIFDHNKKPIVGAFADLLALGIVDYEPVPDRGSPWRQFFVYELCLKRYRMRHQWLMFFDSDEYMMIKDPTIKDLPTFLKPFEPYGGLSINWRVFGSSNLPERPIGSIVKNYRSCTPSTAGINDHIKSIVNTRFALSHASNPHAFMYQKGYYAVNENKTEIYTGKGSSRGAITMGKGSTDIVVLYHYTTKSIGEYIAKVMRGSVNKTPGKTLQWFEDLDAECIEECNIDYMAGRMSENPAVRALPELMTGWPRPVEVVPVVTIP